MTDSNQYPFDQTNSQPAQQLNHQECNCHDCTQTRYRNSLQGQQGQIDMAMQGSHLSNAPSEPIDLSEDDIEAATQWCSEIAGESLRKEYIKIDAANRALVRTIAQLRQRVKDVDKSAKSLYLALYQCGVVIEFVPGSPKIRNQRAETAEQQLAQLQQDTTELVADRDRIASEAVTRIERLEQRLAQKDKRIAEVTENCRLAYNKVAGLEQRIAELEGGVLHD
jgi:chromosome segregation ATPase